MRVQDVIVADRHRRDLGDIDGLARSIQAVGLLHPIVVRPDRTLIVGQRRLEAVKRLGWAKVPVTVAPSLSELDQLLQAESDENTERKGFLPTEGAALARAIEQAYKPTAEAAEKAGKSKDGKAGGRGRRKNPGKTFPRVSDDGSGDTISPKPPRDESARAKAVGAKAAGFSRPTLAKIEAVIASGDKQLIEEMDRAGKADGAYRKLKHRKAQQEAAAQVVASPDRPVVELSSWDAWLPKQADCDLLLTDPPYSTDVPDIGAFAADWLPKALAKVKPTGRAYVFIGAYPEELLAYLTVASQVGPVPLDQVLVWAYENTLGPAPQDRYKLNWQAILYFRGPQAPPLDCPLMVEQFSVQDVPAPDGRQGNRYHAWQKPDELAERLVRHATRAGELVLDPFCCTGTFVIAAAKLGRIGRGCDNCRENLDIAVSRGCLDARALGGEQTAA